MRRVRGLSPRGRGNQHRARRGAVRAGPIPARAGEPSCRAMPSSVRGAYPRAGGGTLDDLVLGAGCHGPIPARAGEPPCVDRGCILSRAYPRAGGGTTNVQQLGDAMKGLSPRGRGNRGVRARYAFRGGPIPARAGEPSLSGRRSSPSRAYPRAGGGTSTSGLLLSKVAGLSPRGRGNQYERRYPDDEQGPIPARAGEP